MEVGNSGFRGPFLCKHDFRRYCRTLRDHQAAHRLPGNRFYSRLNVCGSSPWREVASNHGERPRSPFNRQTSGAILDFRLSGRVIESCNKAIVVFRRSCRGGRSWIAFPRSGIGRGGALDRMSIRRVFMLNTGRASMGILTLATPILLTRLPGVAFCGFFLTPAPGALALLFFPRS